MSKFKTVDELVEDSEKGILPDEDGTLWVYIRENSKVAEYKYDSIYDYILYQLPELLLTTLKSDSNRSSKHDLLLIQHLNYKLSEPTMYDINILNEILQVYSNRK